MTTTALALELNGAGPIVMVDDSHTDFDIARRMYARSALDNDFLHLESGLALLEHLDERQDADEPMPALVLMDLNMPGMNGIETTAALRARPEYRHIPVVAMLTSSVDPKDRSRAEEAGATAYFAKPMDPTDYIEMFNSLKGDR